MIPGIDVSNHQGAIRWPKVAETQQFAVMKATESTDYTDPYFATNWAGAKAAGLVRGAYCFGRPSAGSGKADAEHFLSVVTCIEAGDILVLDIEDDHVGQNADLLAYTLDWLRTVEAKVGFKPLIYSGRYYMGPHNLEGHAELADYGIWLASYSPAHPSVPPPWSFWAMWQWTDRGSVAGVFGHCDQDWFNGDLAALKRYGKP